MVHIRITSLVCWYLFAAMSLGRAKLDQTKAQSGSLPSGKIESRGQQRNTLSSSTNAPVTSANLKKIIQELEETDYGVDF